MHFIKASTKLIIKFGMEKVESIFFTSKTKKGATSSLKNRSSVGLEEILSNQCKNNIDGDSHGLDLVLVLIILIKEREIQLKKVANDLVALLLANDEGIHDIICLLINELFESPKLLNGLTCPFLFFHLNMLLPS